MQAARARSRDGPAALSCVVAAAFGRDPRGPTRLLSVGSLTGQGPQATGALGRTAFVHPGSRGPGGTSPLPLTSAHLDSGAPGWRGLPCGTQHPQLPRRGRAALCPVCERGQEAGTFWEGPGEPGEHAVWVRPLGLGPLCSPLPLPSGDRRWGYFLCKSQSCQGPLPGPGPPQAPSPVCLPPSFCVLLPVWAAPPAAGGQISLPPGPQGGSREP